ncbi:ornithine cyclodeaminase family protein [Fulvivirga ulvae]|uniref:ornithine cyclodeaminase family protein n=1 Tax=Fulvivirga ulvae TaxID=2904245 RepID=UPI001F3CF194|nr:ornithine cyclodeaminase family protein [Fulvivirga ulvae]UII34631.1 ornithine cyclodeaminase family protein [Fulvivirga ulvae]
MKFIDSHTIAKTLQPDALVDKLHEAFKRFEVRAPMRHHHDYTVPGKDRESTLLLMPAWLEGESLGVKMVSVSPFNDLYNLPSIQGLYILNNATTGQTELILDAKELTVRRTAAASALASRFLSRKDSHSLLMIGTGALAPHLIMAHRAVRPISKVFVWGRDVSKAEQLCSEISLPGSSYTAIDSIEEVIGEVDIVSCATLSKTPLILGEWLRPGQHVDLVGAYRPDMREADDNVVKRACIYVDTYQGALKETGDLVIPLREGVIDKEDIKAELKELCNGSKAGRSSDDQITCFKSVGHAIEDLVAAMLIKENLGKIH